MSYIIIIEDNESAYIGVICKKCNKEAPLIEENRIEGQLIRKYEGCCGNSGLEMCAKGIYK